ncbi:MAG: hypothetical protein ACFFDN_04090 [Candidatus Hodarchaeota archaeon]
MEGKIKVSNLRLSITWQIAILLIVLITWIFWFEISFNEYENSVYYSSYPQIAAFFIILPLIVVPILFMFSYKSEIAHFNTFRRDKILRVPPPYKYSLLLAFLLFPLIFLFPLSLFWVNFGTFIIGYILGLILGILVFRLKLHTKDSLLEIKFDKNYYLILSPQKFPIIGEVTIHNGNISENKAIQIMFCLLLVILSLNLIIYIIPSDELTLPLFEAYLIGYSVRKEGSPNPLLLFQFYKHYYQLHVELSVRLFRSGYNIFGFTTIFQIILHYSKDKNFQWLPEYIQNILKKL